ncbi:MAG: hypothetical protein IKY75_05525 [Bacteroidaceae bacterium]|nr:hypothetical protein [Bacteroidaceae bacterium]
MHKLYKMILAALVVLPIFVSCTSVPSKTSPVGHEAERETMRNAVEYMVTHYPDASLCDIYKSCFQDYFGPAHAIASKDMAREYIARELQQVSSEDTLYYESCGWRGNYYRVNLSVVACGVLTVDELADAFYRSTPAQTPVVDTLWVDEWSRTMQIVREVVGENAHKVSRQSPLICNFSTDSAAIADMLAQGRYVIHHTDRYVELYNPHYRIVARDIFNKEILPRLRKR